MWSLITSTGQRVDGITHEQDARHMVDKMSHGRATRVGMYAWTVNGTTVEIRHGR